MSFTKNFWSVVGLIFFLLLLACAGYLSFDRLRAERRVTAASRTAPPAERVSPTGGVDFIHPIFGYRLLLPYEWQGKYRVEETSDQTNFWSDDGSAAPALLASLKVFPLVAESALPLAWQTLGQSSFARYGFSLPTASGAEADRISSLQRSVAKLANTFRPPLSGVDVALRQVIADTASTTRYGTSRPLRVAAYETLLTHPGATTTDYYLWTLWQDYYWEEGRPQAGRGGSIPLFVSLAAGEYPPVRTSRFPRSDENYPRDIAVIFPLTLTKNPLFQSTSSEHQALIDKLARDLADRTRRFFGGEPILSDLAKIITATTTSAGPTLQWQKVTILPWATGGARLTCAQDLLHCRRPGWYGVVKNKKIEQTVFSPTARVEGQGGEVILPNSFLDSIKEVLAGEEIFVLEVQSNKIVGLKTFSP